MIKGFRFAGITCGIKKNGKKDLALVVFEKPCNACGVFTKNRVKAPSVDITKERIAKRAMRALLVVSGNACVCVRQARADSLTMTAELAKALKIKEGEIAHAATGVIGMRLPVEKAVNAYPVLIAELKDDHAAFSEAITTTDAFQKIVETECVIGNKTIKLLGTGKGAGMIMPDMATMLMFIFTDANIAKPALAKAFREAVSESFNCISVDGDTSTNDMVLVFASGMADNRMIRSGSPDWKKFRNALKDVCLQLAKLVVRDGEGATKLIEITVKGAASVKAAKQVARTIANSQLVKTAFFGQDPNWGRLMAAVGRSGVAIRQERIDIDVQGMPVVRKGFEAEGFSEQALQQALQQKDIFVVIDLRQGKSAATFYASDLTLEYVKINSAYRT